MITLNIDSEILPIILILFTAGVTKCQIWSLRPVTGFKMVQHVRYIKLTFRWSLIGALWSLQIWSRSSRLERFSNSKNWGPQIHPLKYLSYGLYDFAEFAKFVPYMSSEVAKWLKSTYVEIQHGRRRPNFQSLNRYNSANNFFNLAEIRCVDAVWVREVAKWLKSPYRKIEDGI